MARHLLARAFGVESNGATYCALCGDAPYASAGSTARVLGDGFADQGALEDPQAADVCVGCQRLLAGRPGDDPPPLRTYSFAVIGDRFVALADRAALWSLLVQPPADLQLLSWTRTRKRHHWLWAEPADADGLVIGSDQGPIRYCWAREAPFRDALVTLRRACTIDEVQSGHYRAPSILALGASAWREAEAIVEPRRGDRVMALLLAHLPAAPHEPRHPAPEIPMLSETDEQAVTLLQLLAHGSAARVHDGLNFWNAFYRRRVVRHMHRDLQTFTSRMLDDLRVEPLGEAAQQVTQHVAIIDDDAAARIMAAIRAQSTLLIALAFDAQKRAKIAKAAQQSLPSVEASMRTPRTRRTRSVSAY
jgi:hypothetical protein